MLGGVGDDDALGPFGACDRYRDVGREAAVGEKAAVIQLRREDQRHGDARPDGLGEVAREHHDHRVAAAQIGRDRTERDRERIEVPAGEQIALAASPH